MFKSTIEELGVQYEERDGLLYPLISNEEEQVDVGKYGLLWIRYMRENESIRFTTLTRFGMVNGKAHQVNEDAYELLDSITSWYLRTHKPKNPNSTMEMWTIREQAKMLAEEIVLQDVVYRWR